MTELPEDVLVMISDEAGAGRIVVELGAFVRLNVAIDEQLASLEERMLRDMPQLALRSLRSRTVHQSPDNQSPDNQSPDNQSTDHQSPDHWSG